MLGGPTRTRRKRGEVMMEARLRDGRAYLHFFLMQNRLYARPFLGLAMNRKDRGGRGSMVGNRPVPRPPYSSTSAKGENYE